MPQKSTVPAPIKVQIAYPQSLKDFPYPRPVPLQLLVRDYDLIKLDCDGCGGGLSYLTQPIEDAIQYGNIKWNLITPGSLNKPYLNTANLKQTEEEIEDLRKKIKDLEQEINALERRRDQLASTRDQRRKKLQGEIVALESVKAKATTDKARLDSEIKKLDSEIQQIKQDIETRRKEVEEKQKSIKDKLKEIEDLNSKIAGEPGARAQRLSQQIEALETDLERAQARYDNTRQQNAQAEQGLFNATNGAEQALDQAIINRDQSAVQAVALQNQIRSLEGQLFATPLMRGIIDAQGRITRMANALANTLPGVRPPVNNIRELQRLLSAPSAEWAGILQNMIASGQDYVNSLRAQCGGGNCQSQIDAIEQQFTELNNRLDQAIQDPNQLIDPDVWEQLQDVRGQLKALLPQLQAAEQAVNQAQQAVNKANQAYLDALRRYEQQEQAILDEIERLQNQIGDLNQQLARQIREDAIETELNTPEWKKEIAQLQSEIDVLYAEINALRNDLDSLRKQLNRKEAEHRQKTLLSSEQQTIISSVTRDIDNKRQELQVIDTEDQELENEIKLKKETLEKLQKDLEDLLTRASSTLDGNKQASGMQNWFIPPPLEKLIKQPAEFDRYKKDVAEKEAKLAEAEGAKKALQKEAYSIIKDVTSALWAYKSAAARVTDIDKEITALGNKKFEQQAENSRNKQGQLRQAQERKAKIDAEKVNAEQAVIVARNDEKLLQDLVDSEKKTVEYYKSELEKAEVDAKAKRSLRESKEKARATRQRTVADARGKHESLLGRIRAQETKLAAIGRDKARQAAAGNDQGAASLAQAAAAARRQLKSLQTQLENNRTALSRAEADLRFATGAENAAVDEERRAIDKLIRREKALRQSRQRLNSNTSIYEADVKRRQEAERKAKDLENQSNKAQDNIPRTNQAIASSPETEELDKKIAAKEKEKDSAENDKTAAEDTYAQLVKRRNKFYEDEKKADKDIADAKLALEDAEQALKDYLEKEIDRIDLEVVININNINDEVIDDWRTDDQPRDTALKIQYQGRRIVNINLGGADPDLEPPEPTNKDAVCNPSLDFDKGTALTAPGKPRHKAQEPETVALWYQEGKPLYEMWPPVTRVFAGPGAADTGAQTRERGAAKAAGAAANAAGGPDDSDQEAGDKRRLMRSADWWTYGGADKDKITIGCSPGGGTVNVVRSGGGAGLDSLLPALGKQCLPGQIETSVLADMTRSSWIGETLTSKNEDEWMMKVPEVPKGQCEAESTLEVNLDDTGYQDDDMYKSGSDKYQHIPGVWGDKSKDVRDFDSEHKTQLKVQLYDGAHKGLEGETIEWRVLDAAGPDLEDDKYGLTNERSKQKLDEQTDKSGYSKLDFYLEADYGNASIEVKWKRGQNVCKTVNIDVKRLLELQKLDMGFGPRDGWEQGEEFFKDGTDLGALAGKLPKETKTVVVFAVGLINDRFEPYDDAEIEFSQQAAQDGVTIKPEKMKTRAYGLAWTRVTKYPNKAELKLAARVESKLTDFTDPASVEGEQNTRTINQFKIGPEGAQLTIETDEGFVPGDEPWSGTGQLVLPVVNRSANHILEGFDKLELKIDGLEVDPAQGDAIPVARSGEVRWPGDDNKKAFKFVRRHFTFTLGKLGLSAGNDGLVEGSVEIKTGSGNSDKASANFSATIGPNGFFGSLSDMPEITLAGMKLEKGANIDLDLHTKKDPSPLPSFGPGKTWETQTNDRRQGLLIRQASVILPEALKGANDTPPKLSVKDLLINASGISGEVTLQHTIMAGMGQLNFAINEVNLILSQNQPTGTTIKGAVKLPEPYVGEIAGEINVTGGEYSFSAKTETPVSMPQLGMVFHIQLLEARYADDKFNFEIKDALLKSESFSDFSINKFKFDSDGNFDARLTFSDKSLKFANGFDIELKELEFSMQEGSKYSVGVKSDFRFAAISADDVNFRIENGPTIKELEIDVKYDRAPVKVGGKIVYKAGLFEGKVDVDARALSLDATLIMGSQKEPDKSTWTFWYVELNTRTVIPLGQTGVSIIELGGAVGYNYDPPIGSIQGAPRKTDTLSLKAAMGLGDAPTTGRVFAGRTQLVLVSGRFSINGKVWVLNQESAIFGEGQLNFYWAPKEKVDGFVRMGLNIPDQAGKILAFNGDVGFRFNSANDWEIKSRRLDGSMLERVLSKGVVIDIKPGQARMKGALSYKIYKEVGVSKVTLKAQVALKAKTSLNIRISDNSSSLNTTAKFNGSMNLKLDTPVREFELAAAEVKDSEITFNATQTGSKFSGSIAGTVDASWNVWGFEGSQEIDIGYNF